MGYYLPINDYAAQQYRIRVKNVKSPYHIERKYKIVFKPVTNDNQSANRLLYTYAQKQKKGRKLENKQRFSLEKGSSVTGKGERINVQA